MNQPGRRIGVLAPPARKSLIPALVLLMIALLTPLTAGQRRSAPIARINPTSDALVFGDRNFVYYLAPNSTAPRRLAKGNFPALSADRRQVAYCTPIDATKSAPETVTVMVFDLASGRSTAVLKANAWANHLRWSPNGGRLLLTLAYLNGKRELTTVASDGSDKRKVIGGGEQGANDIFSPVWAPDSQSIYFHDMSNLFQVSTDGRLIAKTSLGTIAEEKDSVTSSDSFVPSPNDPNVIAYTRSVQGSKLFERTFGEPNTALFIYNVQTKTHRRISPVDLLALDPVWSRDGRFIYFSGYRDREGRAAYPFKIYRINADGTGLIQIASGENPGV